MDYEYQTNRLILRILPASMDNASQVLLFYDKNREIFEPLEPSRPDNFYTVTYQHTLLNCEYHLALERKAFRYWIFLKSSPETMIGTICFQNITHSAFESCETGYKLDPIYWNNGYAKEALHEIIGHIFEEQSLHRIKAYVLPGNEASVRLLTRLGFEYEGYCRSAVKLQNIWKDHLQYSLIAGCLKDIEKKY